MIVVLCVIMFASLWNSYLLLNTRSTIAAVSIRQQHPADSDSAPQVRLTSQQLDHNIRETIDMQASAITQKSKVRELAARTQLPVCGWTLKAP
jgi:hypothetical protein